MGKRRTPIRRITICAIFTALVAVCTQIQIPIPMLPVNLALFAVHLAGATLGAKYGALSLAAYALLGGVGAPVFSNFSGGLGVLLGRTGGYIVGYILAAFLVGLLAQKWGRSFGGLCAAMAIGTAVCYAVGLAWFMIVTRLSLWECLVYCVFPPLPGDLLKILLAAWLAHRLQTLLAKSGSRSI